MPITAAVAAADANTAPMQYHMPFRSTVYNLVLLQKRVHDYMNYIMLYMPKNYEMYTRAFIGGKRPIQAHTYGYL